MVLADWPSDLPHGLEFDATRQRPAAHIYGQGTWVWDLGLERWKRCACQLAGRTLTRDEWRRSLGTYVRYMSPCARPG